MIIIKYIRSVLKYGFSKCIMSISSLFFHEKEINISDKELNHMINTLTAFNEELKKIQINRNETL
jgi:hypothetical protein